MIKWYKPIHWIRVYAKDAFEIESYNEFKKIVFKSRGKITYLKCFIFTEILFFKFKI